MDTADFSLLEDQGLRFTKHNTCNNYNRKAYVFGRWEETHMDIYTETLQRQESELGFELATMELSTY